MTFFIAGRQQTGSATTSTELARGKFESRSGDRRVSEFGPATGHFP